MTTASTETTGVDSDLFALGDVSFTDQIRSLVLQSDREQALANHHSGFWNLARSQEVRRNHQALGQGRRGAIISRHGSETCQTIVIVTNVDRTATVIMSEREAASANLS